MKSCFISIAAFLLMQFFISKSYLMKRAGLLFPSSYCRIFSSDICSVLKSSKMWQFSQHRQPNYSTFSPSSRQLPFIPILISIEGNIGAGKTTLLEKLRINHPEWHSIDEPVETWTKIKNEQGQSILEVFYQDRKRWSYTFQNCALLTRHENIEKKVDQIKDRGSGGIQVFLTERCLDTDYYVFTRMLLEEGSITKMEIELYERLLRHLQLNATPLSAIIHVNTSPLVCKDRIKTRGRTGEEAITFDYLEKLNKYQSKWIDSTNIPTLATENTNYQGVERFILNLKEKTEKDILALLSPTADEQQTNNDSTFEFNSTKWMQQQFKTIH